ncbi:MAG: hypothetical protein LIP01_01585 [Tannerellaceae bacterium]|nr:hypothetical protein [Tannerellaceae bacterium]
MTYNVFSSDIQYPITLLVADNNQVPRYNIIYILLDSWNPSSFDEITCPNIYAFSKKAHIFEKHYSSSYGTQGSLFGLYFGLPFTYEKEFSISRISPVIIDRFIDLDYNIQTFPSATFKAPPFHEMIYRRVPDIMTTSEGKDSFERDNYITEKFREYIDTYTSDKPFFGLLFYDLLHAINIPKEYQKFQPSWDTPEYLSLHNKMDPTPFLIYTGIVSIILIH